MVEQSAVNRRVTSSNLVSGARYEKPAIPKREAGFFRLATEETCLLLPANDDHWAHMGV